MSATTNHTQRPEIGRPARSQVTALRRASITALVLLLVQYGIGIGVNLYLTIPAADHGHGFGTAISNGPAALSVHIILGLLLILAAAGLLVQAIVARHAATIAASAVALLAIIGAAFEGTDFVRSGHPAASMTMAVLTGVAVLCYAVILYPLGPARHA